MNSFLHKIIEEREKGFDYKIMEFFRAMEIHQIAQEMDNENRSRALDEQRDVNKLTATQKKSYQDNIRNKIENIKSFSHSTLILVISEIVKEMEAKKLVNTKDEATSDWFYGYGYNSALSDIISSLREEIISLKENK